MGTSLLPKNHTLKNWNEHCKHKDPSTFKDQDKQLQVQIIRKRTLTDSEIKRNRSEVSSN
jgi:hypothetical protein